MFAKVFQAFQSISRNSTYLRNILEIYRGHGIFRPVF